MNALVIETAFLGDAIVSLSLARSIKVVEPAATITYLVRPDAVEIVRASPDVDHVIAFDKRGKERGVAGIRKKAAELNERAFDTLFLLHSSRRSQQLASLLNIKKKIGFENMKHATLTDAIPDSGWSDRYERAVSLLKPLSPEIPFTILPRVIPQVTEEVEGFSNRFEHVVTLAPGSAWETKKWGDTNFIQLAHRLMERGVGVILLGGSDAVGAVQRTLPHDRLLDLISRVSLLESAGAIARSRVLVSNDSAPMHLAVAVNTPVVALFGPTVPEFGFAPPVNAGIVIQNETLWCRPCASHGSNVCPIYTHECMTSISVDRVLESVMQYCYHV